MEGWTEERLGDISTLAWDQYTFGDLVEKSRGGISIKSKEYSNSGIPVLTKGDVKPFGGLEHGGKYVDSELVSKQGWPLTSKGDLMVTTRDLKPSAPFLGLVSQIPGDSDYLVNQGATFFSIKNELVMSEYFVYWSFTNAYREHVISRKSGSTQVHIRQADLFAAPISLPPLPEQKRIVAILDEAFEGIDAAIANTEKNLANARELFDSYLNDVFTKKGEGWEEATISEVCTLKSGTTVPKSIEKSCGDLPYIKVAEMTMEENAEGITTSIRFLSSEDVKKSWIIPSGATIFPKRGGAIQTNKKRILLTDVCLDLNLMSVMPSSKILPEYLYMYFLNVDMKILGNGSSIPQINNGDINPLIISFPVDRKNQNKIVERFSNFSSEHRNVCRIYQQKLNSLDELKQSLLAKAFSGELTVQPDQVLKEAVG